MDDSLEMRIKNLFYKFEVNVTNSGDEDATYTLDFESGEYRQSCLVGLIREIVPYFALTSSEIDELDKSEWFRQSYTRISDAHQNSKGDYGELLLYAILSIFYDVPKFVTKARLRSTTREQIKGFDCAHFSIDPDDDQVTLWLGEAKFHKNISGAISSAFNSLTDHLNNPVTIKSELKLLGGEIEINRNIEPKTYNLLKNYVSGGKSLDKIPITVPVLITYDSDCINSYTVNDKPDIDSEHFKQNLQEELTGHFEKIYKKSWPGGKNLKVVFIIVPLKSVKELKAMIDMLETVMKF